MSIHWNCNVAEVCSTFDILNKFKKLRRYNDLFHVRKGRIAEIHLRLIAQKPSTNRAQ